MKIPFPDMICIPDFPSPNLLDFLAFKDENPAEQISLQWTQDQKLLLKRVEILIRQST